MNYNKIAYPLIKLTKGYPVGKGKAIQIQTNEECRVALDSLKKALVRSVCLKYPDFNKKFIITTDASLRGLGAQLGQLDKAGHMRPISFVSRALELSETRYPAVELECLAIVFALEQIRLMILGYEVVLTTDH